jgi:hypothetical protein
VFLNISTKTAIISLHSIERLVRFNGKVLCFLLGVESKCYIRISLITIVTAHPGGRAV